jgi:hypothetical protein
VIKPVKDEDATRCTNGEPVEVTETMYYSAPRIYKWCAQCDEVTEHLKLWAALYQRYAIVCNASKHTIKLGG